MVNNFIKSKAIDESMYYTPVIEKTASDAGVDILVLVLGESASAARWSLLGYKKNETNKPLVGIKNAISATSISNGPYTLLALPFMLLGESAADAKNNSRASIIDFAKENGYKTFVFTNSRFYDRAEDFFNLILRRNSDVYVKTGDGGYDENLSYWLEDALKNKSAKKLIVLHTYGSHVAVDERYPKEYSVFDDEYDNSIFYTSILLDSWIQKIKTIPDKKSALIYMSDHGLMMPPCSDSFRAGYAKTSFEVPLFIWASENNLISDVRHSLDRRAAINSASFYNLSINFLGGKLPMFIFNKTGVFNPKDVCNVQR